MAEDKIKEEVVAEEADKKAAAAKKKAATARKKKAEQDEIKKEVADQATTLKKSDYVAVNFKSGARKHEVKGVPYEGEIAGDIMIVYRSDLNSNQVFKGIMKLARIAARVRKSYK